MPAEAVTTQPITLWYQRTTAQGLSRIGSLVAPVFTGVIVASMTEPKKISGPASYFPSIEKKYGVPIEHWLQLVGQQSGMKHMEIVNWLKAEHGLGHGHANAIVAYSLAQPVR